MAPDFPWLILGLVALAALVGVIIWVVAQGGATSGRKRSAAREVEENLEGQIMAMVHQAGTPLSQIEIALALDVATAKVAAAARELERKGWITRAWDPLEYTYHVELPAERAAQPGGQP